MNKEEIEELIDQMKVWKPVYKIEEESGLPATTIQKVLAGKRELPKKWIKPLRSYFSAVSLADPTKTKTSEIKPPEASNTTINTKQASPFMNDAIRKKLGL